MDQEMSQTTSTNQELPLLTFNSLYNVLREEKRKKTLQELPELFYEALQKFLSEKKELMKKLKETGEKEKLIKEKNILGNAKKISQELLSLRGSKIAKIAIQNAFSEEKVLEEDTILPKEVKLFETTQKHIKNIQKEFI